MKHIKLFENFDENHIHNLCQKYGIEDYVINNGLVDVSGDVDLADKKLREIPIKFGKVTGGFYCEGNELTSLEGSPKEVWGPFDCSLNNLKSLGGSPTYVGEYFSCVNNQLTSLEGCPKTLVYSFDCSYNNLTSLEGCSDVGDDFYCQSNKLTSLVGGPKKVGGSFTCDHNRLTDLEGMPKELSEFFNCSDNLLTTLKGCPKSFDQNFYCNNNNIYTLDFDVRFSNIEIGGNPIKVVVNLFSNWDQFIDSLEYTYFVSEKEISFIRLDHALKEFDKSAPISLPFYKYVR